MDKMGKIRHAASFNRREDSHLRVIKHGEMKLIREMVEYASLKIPTRQFRMSTSVFRE
jgi:hypothetical protein